MFDDCCIQRERENDSMKMSELRKFRCVRWVVLIVACGGIVWMIISDPQAHARTSLMIVLIAVLATFGPLLIQSHIIGAAEVLLDRKCDPAALVRRGDKMKLTDRTPNNGLYRVEAVFLHRYGIALSDVGRMQDAAKVRRRIEEGLAKRQKPTMNADCTVMDMCLADLCARLGDAEAAKAYADQYQEGLKHLPESVLTKEGQDLELLGRVMLSSSAVLFLSKCGALPFDEGNVNVLDVGSRRRHLTAEARMVLAEDARRKGDLVRERKLLEQVADAAPGMRVGQLAAKRLAFYNGTGTSAGYDETLQPAEPVDVHPAVLKNYEKKN